MITGAAGMDRDPDCGLKPDRICSVAARRAQDKAKRSGCREDEGRFGNWPRVCGDSPLSHYMSGDRPPFSAVIRVPPPPDLAPAHFVCPIAHHAMKQTVLG